MGLLVELVEAIYARFGDEVKVFLCGVLSVRSEALVGDILGRVDGGWCLRGSFYR